MKLEEKEKKRVSPALLAAIRGLIEAHGRLELIPLDAIERNLEEIGVDCDCSEFQEAIDHMVNTDPYIKEKRCVYYSY